jgi:hypothetical protein
LAFARQVILLRGGGDRKTPSWFPEIGAERWSDKCASNVLVQRERGEVEDGVEQSRMMRIAVVQFADLVSGVLASSLPAALAVNSSRRTAAFAAGGVLPM